jgi:predicted RNA binding protein YcfA (HicA-like mRNA interferase family)
VSYWPSSKGRKVLKALLAIGWRVKERKGSSHTQLVHDQLGEYTWAFSDSEEIGPVMLARIAKKTGLTREDL